MGCAANNVDVVGGVVLRGRCPSCDDLPDGAALVLQVVGGEQHEGCAESPRNVLELTELLVCREVSHAEPLRFRASDVQRIVVSFSSCHRVKMGLMLLI